MLSFKYNLVKLQYKEIVTYSNISKMINLFLIYSNHNSSSATWSSVTSSQEIAPQKPLLYQSLQFQHEFPSLDGSNVQAQSKGNRGSINPNQQVKIDYFAEKNQKYILFKFFILFPGSTQYQHTQPKCQFKCNRYTNECRSASHTKRKSNRSKLVITTTIKRKEQFSGPGKCQ